ncbi:hypothetical protein E2C01_022116 [Portunus trituberculatus]|uniref:Uncharacterized protein n=1 Tax=Portunus trituberculatus TaxID=210409 RepID=A0A5B7E6T4_PORTR|nr:hypothetical protein [Portunus trituberculatus]
MVRQPRGRSRVVGGGARRLGGTNTQVLQCSGFFMGTVRPSGDIIHPNMPQKLEKNKNTLTPPPPPPPPPLPSCPHTTHLSLSLSRSLSRSLSLPRDLSLSLSRSLPWSRSLSRSLSRSRSLLSSTRMVSGTLDSTMSPLSEVKGFLFLFPSMVWRPLHPT